jgi:hypothetical protein
VKVFADLYKKKKYNNRKVVGGKQKFHFRSWL